MNHPTLKTKLTQFATGQIPLQEIWDQLQTEPQPTTASGHTISEIPTREENTFREEPEDPPQ